MRRSLAAGCAGIVLTPPFYFKGVDDEGVYRWFSEAIEAAGAGARDVILYHLPQVTGVSIAEALTGRLRRAFPEVIAGVKDSGGNWEHTASLLGEHRDLAILVGHEGHLARAVRQGASGAISGIANVAPRLCAEFQAACQTGDYAKALELQDRLYPLHAALFTDASPGPVKYALCKLRPDFPKSLRLPMTSEPRLLVMITTVFLKSTVRPWPSVSRPSSSTCSRMLKTSGCAFSISSSSRTAYGVRRTASVSWPAS